MLWYQFCCILSQEQTRHIQLLTNAANSKSSVTVSVITGSVALSITWGGIYSPLSPPAFYASGIVSPFTPFPYFMHIMQCQLSFTEWILFACLKNWKQVMCLWIRQYNIIQRQTISQRVYIYPSQARNIKHKGLGYFGCFKWIIVSRFEVYTDKKG